MCDLNYLYLDFLYMFGYKKTLLPGRVFSFYVLLLFLYSLDVLPGLQAGMLNMKKKKKLKLLLAWNCVSSLMWNDGSITINACQLSNTDGFNALYFWNGGACGFGYKFTILVCYYHFGDTSSSATFNYLALCGEFVIYVGTGNEVNVKLGS
jgi:hypothetical protein